MNAFVIVGLPGIAPSTNATLSVQGSTMLPNLHPDYSMLAPVSKTLSGRKEIGNAK